MLASALRHPMPGSTAPASVTAPRWADERCPPEEADEEHVAHDFLVTEGDTPDTVGDAPDMGVGMHNCMWGIVSAGEVPKGVTDVAPLPVVCLSSQNSGGDWWARLRHARTLVLDEDALNPVVEEWELYVDYCISAAADSCMEPVPFHRAGRVMDVVRAADRQRQGVIVHSDCSPVQVVVGWA
jgi:hypothetical protein